MKYIRYPLFTFFKILLLAITLYSCQTNTNSLYDIDIKEVWIPMADGTRLAADLYIPKGVDANEKFPVLLEYIPYRKDEQRKLRYSVFSYFVQRGYIVARVDIRGTGRSEGKLIDYEYTEEEKEDGITVIDWLAKQDFSTGSIGMFGISWGGFNAIHLGMRNPPALKAIVAMMATDDIYEDDVHFIDGMMHIDAYEIGRDLKNVIPGAPDYIIDEKYFKNKFDTEPWLLKYKRQQRDSEFWDVNSLNSDYSQLQTPIFMISGWYDGYRDSTPKIFQNVSCATKAIIGPWNHTFPNMASPPPSIEWRKEVVKWFDYWLKGIENGVLKEPKIAAFIRDGHGPGVPDEITGKWVSFNSWPPKGLQDVSFYLTETSLDTVSTVPSSSQTLNYVASSGIEASGSVMWWGDWSPDQKNSDKNNLVFETEPLEKDIQILGFPKLHFNAAVSNKQAHFISKLSDVAPNNSVTLITGAGLNGSHRNSSKNPEYLEPNTIYPLDIDMHFTSWTFKKGHRIRVTISNSQWPMIWPNPSLLEMTVILGGKNASHITLPTIINEHEFEHVSFEPPAEDPKLEDYQVTQSGTVSGFAEISETKYDSINSTTQVIATNSYETAYPWANWTTSEHIVHEVSDLEPSKAAVISNYSIKIDTDQHTLEWRGILDFRSDKKNFYYEYTRQLSKDSLLIRTRTWKESIPRDFQ